MINCSEMRTEGSKGRCGHLLACSPLTRNQLITEWHAQQHIWQARTWVGLLSETARNTMELYSSLMGRATMLCALTEKVSFWSPLNRLYGDTGFPSQWEPAISYENLFLMTHILHLVSRLYLMFYILCSLSYIYSILINCVLCLISYVLHLVSYRAHHACTFLFKIFYVLLGRVMLTCDIGWLDLHA